MKKITLLLLTISIGVLLHSSLVAKENKDNATMLKSTASLPDSSSWTLVKMDGVKSKQMHPINKAVVIIVKKDNKMVVFSSCNTIKAKIAFKDSASAVVVEKISKPKKECDKAVNDIETLFRETLLKTNSWKIEGDKLYLYQDGKETLVFKSLIIKADQ